MFRRPPATETDRRQGAQSVQPIVMGNAAAGEVADLLLRLGRILLTSGLAAHRIESFLNVVATELCYRVDILSTPTALIIALETDQGQEVRLVRSAPGAPNLGKLARINSVMEQLKAGQININQACAEAERIHQQPAMPGTGLALLAYLLISVAITPLLGGGWRELILAGGLGIITGVLALSTQAAGVNWARLFTPLAATVVAFVGALYCHWQPQTSLLLPLIAGLATLLPGLDFTAATRELATSHLVSGSSRMAGALVVLVTMAFGIAIGTEIAQQMFGELSPIASVPLPGWVQIPALVIAAVGLAVLFSAEVQDWVWILVVCAVAMLGIQLGQHFIGQNLGAALGGLLVGITGNLFVRYRGRPALILQTPGLILLVPGALGLRSLTALVEKDVITGIESFFSVFMIAVALATGLIMASVVVPPRREL